MNNKLREYYLNMLMNIDKEYLEENNLIQILNWLATPNENNFVKACIRCSEEYQNVIYDEEVIYEFLKDYKNLIEDRKSVYEEEYLYTKKELYEKYDEDYKEEVIKLINIYNSFIMEDNSIYEVNQVFNCLRNYIAEQYRFKEYVHNREMVYLNEYITDEEQEQKSYLEMTIEDIIVIAMQYRFRYKIA